MLTAFKFMLSFRVRVKIGVDDGVQVRVECTVEVILWELTSLLFRVLAGRMFSYVLE
jgi:hypothetical protein